MILVLLIVVIGKMIVLFIGKGSIFRKGRFGEGR